MSAIRKYILDKVSSKELSNAEALQLLSELNDISKKDINPEEDIAVIGIACKLPLGNDPVEFWNNLKNGVSGIDFWPSSRIDDIAHIVKTPQYSEFYLGKYVPLDFYDQSIYLKGGYLNEIDKFDADFFGIPPREATYMDPRHRVVLETAWEAIEDAGYGGNKIYGTRTGVFLGMENTNYTLYQYSTQLDPMHLTGGWVSIQASRISYMYNMRGPCLVVDTACSSGLSALHVAIQSIQNDECDMALSGGINLQMGAVMKDNPGINNLSSVESKTEVVKTFDKDSDGTLWGEGIVFFMLKPLSKAISDRDNIYAVVKATAMNNDGASNGITAPNAEAQEEVVMRAWETAKINPETISYIETHGTGTVLGDPIEVKGLTEAFRKYTTKKQFCAIGSLKPSMGHLVAASGAASMLKVIMSMKNKKMAPTLNFNTPNPYINFVNSPLYVCDKLQDWTVQGFPRRGGVSSFGFSGTNIHAVLEEYEPQHNTENLKSGYCVTISAKKNYLLKDYLAKYKHYITNNDNWNLPDLAFTANTGRGHYAHRLAIIAEDENSFRDKINMLAESNELFSVPEAGIFYDNHKIINDRKEKKEGEIYAEDRKKYTNQANEIIGGIENNQNYLQSLTQLAELYVKGADISFDKLYSDEKRYRISIPTYPLERVRFWAEHKESKFVNELKGESYDHPLIERCVIKTINTNIYTTLLNVKDFWVLEDHRISGRAAIPGTSYLEIAYRLGRDLFNTQQVTLKDVFFLAPLFVDDDETKEMQIIVEKKDNYYAFVIATGDNNNGWQKHSEGKIYKQDETETKSVNLDTLKKEFAEENDLKVLELDSKSFTFGNRWNSLDIAYENNEYYSHAKMDKKALLKQVLPDSIKADVEKYALHPGMLDNAANYLSQSFGDNIYLPFNYKDLKIYKSLPATSYCYLRSKNAESGNLEVVTFDWDIYDENGQLVATATDYSLKKINPSDFIKQSAIKYYGYKWEHIQPVQPVSNISGNYLVMGKNSELNRKITEAYKSKGAQVINITLTPENMGEAHIDKFIKDIATVNITRIINVVTPEDKVQSVEEFETERKLILNSFFLLIKSLLKYKVKVLKGISVVSENAQVVSGNEKEIHPLANAAFGLAITVGREYETLACKNIDVDTATSIEHITADIELDDERKHVAYRDNKRFRQLFSEERPDKKKDLSIVEGGVYLITGGTGGLGLEVARYLASRNNVKLALVNRSVFPDRSKWAEILLNQLDSKQAKSIKILENIESSGSQVHIFSSDVSDYPGMKNVLDSIQQKLGKIEGVIHAAGVAGQGFIINKDEETFNTVLRPKVDGLWNLAHLLKSQQPQFTVLFSSITTLSGIEGQSDYSAANAYLDGFASAMRDKGVVAINWPGWSDTGMAVDFNVSDNDEYVLAKPISTNDALEALEVILESDVYNIMPGVVNYPYLLNDGKAIELSEDLRKEVEKYLKRQNLAGNKKENKGINKKVIVTGKHETDFLPVELTMAQIWGQVLGLEEIDVFDSFQELGGDSILGTHLLKAINAEFPDMIDISDIYSYPTIVQLSELVAAKLEPVVKEVIQTTQNEDDELKSMLDKIGSGDMSIDGALALFSED